MAKMEPDIDQGSSAALWVVLARAARSMELYVEQSIATLGIGISDFMILEALLHKGPMTMSELCEAVLLTNASMTSAADRLAVKKLVTRKAVKMDRRVRRVELTTEGMSVAMDLYARHRQDLAVVMKGLTLPQRDEMRRGLKIVGLAAAEAVQRHAKAK